MISTRVVTTIAGKAYQAPQVLDGIGLNARFSCPSALWGDGQGLLYVADSTAIRKIDLNSGQVTTVAGSDLVGSFNCIDDVARFNHVSGIWGDGQGNLYVSESERIRKLVISTGEVTTIAGANDNCSYAIGNGTNARFCGLRGLWGDGAGNLYGFDRGNALIRKFSISSGTVTTVAGQPRIFGSRDGIGTNALFSNPNFPSGMITGDGQFLYVSEEFGIRKIELSTGTVTTLAGLSTMGSVDGTGSDARFWNPSGIWLDRVANAAYIADASNHTIRKLDIATQTVSTIAGTPFVSGTSDGFGANARFNNPDGIWGDGLGTLYIVGASNTIRKLVLATGEVTTIAGKPGLGWLDGIGPAAGFGDSLSIWGDGAGNLYIADSLSTIRRLELSTGMVTTIAGAAGHRNFIDGVCCGNRLYSPRAISGDSLGNLYFSDIRAIRKLDLVSGRVSTLLGGWGTIPVDGVGGNAGFDSPQGMWVDPAGYLFVTERNALRKVTLATNSVTTVLGALWRGGLPPTAGASDGSGAAVRFYAPSGITGDGNRLLVTDSASDP